MFYVHFFESGGCDYTVACGERLEPLPESITTMAEAVKYVLDQNGLTKESQLAYYGDNPLRFASVTIFEVTGRHDINLSAVEAERRKMREEAATKQLEIKERQELARLKAKYE